MRLPPVVRLTLVVEGALVLLALGLGVITDLPPFGTLSFTVASCLLGLLATLPLLGFLYWSLATRWSAIVRLRTKVVELVVPMFADCSVAHLAVVALAAGIGEEALFRGVLQPLADRFVPTAAAVGAVAMLFGLAHAVTRTYAVLAGLIGLYLGWLLIVSGTLLVPIVVHALYDFVALLVLVRRAPEHAGGTSEAEATA